LDLILIAVLVNAAIKINKTTQGRHALCMIAVASKPLLAVGKRTAAQFSMLKQPVAINIGLS